MKCIYTEKMDGLLDSMMIASIVDGGWELRKSYKVGQALQVDDAHQQPHHASDSRRGNAVCKPPHPQRRPRGTNARCARLGTGSSFTTKQPDQITPMNNTKMDTTTKDKVARLAERLEGFGAAPLRAIERDSIHTLYTDNPVDTEFAGVALELRDAYDPEETAHAAININGLEITEIPDGAPFRIDCHTLHDLAAFTAMFFIGYKACLADVVHELKPTDTQKGGKQ